MGVDAMMHDLWPYVPKLKGNYIFVSREFGPHADRMDVTFMLRLFGLRLMRPERTLRINSAFRLPDHNAEVGGVKASAHLVGRGVDIDTTGWTPAQRIQLVNDARAMGFTGIGMGRTFIHIDDMPRVASWRYVGKKTVTIPVGSEAEWA